MPISIFHVGLPLDHGTIPAEDRPELTERLAKLKQRMQEAGYNYEILHYSPEAGLGDFRSHLQTHPCDGVFLGGGVVGNPGLASFQQQIIDAVRETAPQAKVMFHSHDEDVRTTIERNFPPAIS